MSDAIKCSDCIYYDEQQKFTPQGAKPAWYGWCAKKSIYPHRDPDGMTAMPDVQRVTSDQPVAVPFIVDGSKVRLGCIEGVKKP